MQNTYKPLFSLMLALAVGAAAASAQNTTGGQYPQDGNAAAMQGPNAEPGPAPAAEDGGWHKFGEAGSGYQSAQMQNGGMPPASAQPNPYPQQGSQYPQQPAQYPQQQVQYPQQQPLPSQLTVSGGTWVTVRVNQPLSTDHNQVGDFFTGTLAQPLIVDGLVVARRGQMIGGRVSEVQKAGHVKGVSRLGLEVTEVSLADGSQLPVKTQLIERRGDTSYGRDATAIGVTTGMGAAIGAAAAGGVGAGIGAGAGLVASTIGVLVTRGRPSVVYPETELTFRVEAPVTIPRISAAFQPVGPQDYQQSSVYPRYRTAPRPAYSGAYYAPYYGYPYPYWGGYWGPSVYFGFGRGFGRRW